MTELRLRPLVGLVTAGLFTAHGRRRAPGPLYLPAEVRLQAPSDGDGRTMPALELLERPAWSRARTAAMYTLRGYLVIAVAMLIVKAIEVGLAH